MRCCHGARHNSTKCIIYALKFMFHASCNDTLNQRTVYAMQNTRFVFNERTFSNIGNNDDYLNLKRRLR